MSGDMNTAMGNCLISAGLLWAYAHERGIRIKAIVDGDDSVAFMERSDLARYLSGIQDWMAKRGFRLVTEEPVSCIAQVEFCQCRYVAAEPPTMVRNPLKAITQDHAWIVDKALTYREVLAATGLGGLSLYGNIPILGAYYHMLAKATTLSRKTLNRISFQDSWLRDATLSGGTYAAPSEAARYSLWEAWGVTPGEQRALEQDFLSRDLSAIDRLDTINNHTLTHYQDYYTICTTTTSTSKVL
nr:MAG: RNA-dependent RNA polymerase [Crogonang virus 99]